MVQKLLLTKHRLSDNLTSLLLGLRLHSREFGLSTAAFA